MDIINREDLKSIIEEGMLDREVMDTYVGLIAEDFEKNGITDQTFMNMVASYCVIMNMEGGIEMNLNEPLWTSINKSRIFFPIHHGNSNHYSLLIMDNKIRKFIHMNPLRPKKMSRTKSTTRMPKKSWFESVKNSEIRPGSECQDGMRDKFKEENEDLGLVYTQAEITPEEEECRQLVLSNDIKCYKIEEDMHCPQ